METTSTYSDLIKGVEIEFADIYVQNKDYYKTSLLETGIFKQMSDAEARKVFYSRPGTGFLQGNNQGGDVNKKTRHPGYKTEAIPHNYDGGVDVTYDDLYFRKYKDKLDEYTDLVRSWNLSKGLLLAMVLNHAWDTSQPTIHDMRITRYGDAVPLASTVHPTRVPGQSTQSNASGSSVDLTYANFGVARKAIVEQLSDDGTPRQIPPKYIIVVGPARRDKALEIAGSALKVDSADNNVNIYRGEIADVVECLFVSTTYDAPHANAWAVIDPNTAKLFLWVAEDLTPSKYIHENRSVSFDVFGKAVAGHYDWRGTWFSKGDGTTYSS